MDQYDVYGVGNALVDKEFEVDEAFFRDYRIKKGVMTLVGREQQDHLLKILSDTYGITKKSGGGSAGNTLYALSHFGGRAYFTCKIANDQAGDFYLEQLGRDNIDTNVTSREDGASGRCLVMISPDAERT
ncbi:MAG: PfkB family carbohydrate kinase, partial [Pseudomonadales bacterium]|nr:PfkB family carbohydrate kinase [Pseudomonadales bacterium]